MSLLEQLGLFAVETSSLLLIMPEATCCAIFVKSATLLVTKLKKNPAKRGAKKGAYISQGRLPHSAMTSSKQPNERTDKTSFKRFGQ